MECYSYRYTLLKFCIHLSKTESNDISKGITFSYRGGEQLGWEVMGTDIKLQCVPDSHFDPEFRGSFSSGGVFVFMFDWKTKHACPIRPRPLKGIGVGGLILIMFVIIIRRILYL